MGVAQRWTLPDKGQRYVVEVDGEDWEINPKFTAILELNEAMDAAGALPGQKLTDSQLAKVKGACVEHLLTEEQQTAFWKFPTERQAIMADKLFRVFNTIISGDPHFNPGEEPEIARANGEKPGEPVGGDGDGPDPTPSPSE